MNPSGSLVSLHLTGEGKDDIALDTLPGKITITRTDAALTPYGGLAAWSGFLKHLGLIERLADHCPVVRTSPNAAPVREVLHSFLLAALVEGKRFCHVRWLLDDPAVATLMGMDRVRGEDALPRLAKGLDAESLRQWMQRPQTELYAALPERFIADWDSTVNTRYGHQEAAAVGYNPHKRGRKSHHPLLCVAAHTRLCLHLEWRPGDTVSATDWQPAMEKLWAHPTNVFDELKNQWGFRGYCRGRAVVTELAARLMLLTYNLWSLFTRLMGLNPGHHTEAIKSRRDFLFMAAQVVESGRQRTVKLAVMAEWWTTLKACYERLRTWLRSTAPQLEEQGQWLRLLPRKHTKNALEWLAQPPPTPSG